MWPLSRERSPTKRWLGLRVKPDGQSALRQEDRRESRLGDSLNEKFQASAAAARRMWTRRRRAVELAVRRADVRGGVLRVRRRSRLSP
mmetsp:Transcript_58391/g.189150  ORF Transcript_58391/g.189150 Transcript_58391/m.189150 type:complete len:88 (+) Transcript_58391:488-751(+)